MGHVDQRGEPATHASSSSEPGVRVHVLGSVRVEVAGHPSQHALGRTAELIGYLAIAGSGERRVARDRAAFALWPDQTERAARRSLAGMLYRLRRSLAGTGSWLVADRDSLQLRAAWVDLDAFVRLAGSADSTERRSAIDLYAGDLLPSVDAEWVDGPRAELRDRYTALLAMTTAEREGEGDLASALALARRWASADPYDESAHRAVMRLFARLGRHPAALDHYDSVVALLDAELGVTPEPATDDLADRIRTDRGLSEPAVTQPRDAPYVGRSDERRLLLRALDEAQGGSGTVMVVLGEAGIGKSRLLEELERAVDWRGWQTAYARGEQFGSPAPLAPLGAALRRSTAPPRLEQLERLVDAVWRAGASPLVPDLAVADPELRASVDFGHLGRSVTEVLRGLGRMAPQLLLLDDMQWADQALWGLLDQMRPTLSEMPVVVVVSGRSDELAAQPSAWTRLQAWDRDRVPWVELRALSTHELKQLSSTFGGRTDPEIDALASASGGNPLLALSLLQSGELATGDVAPAEPRNLQPSLDRLFEHRLRALSDHALAGLEAAAVIGQRFSYSLWEEVADDPELPAAAAELERAQLLRTAPDGYGFAHDTLRSLVLWRTAPERRRGLHAAALTAVQRRTPDAVTSLLFHAEQVQDWPAVAAWSQRAGEEALDSLSFQAAARHFTRALEVLPADDRTARFAALAGRVRALDVLAERDAQRADLIELEQLADTLGGTDRQVGVATQLAAFHWAVGEFATGEAVAAAAVARAEADGDAAGQAALLTVLGRLQREQGDLPTATTNLTRAQALYGRLRDVHGSATALELLGGIAWRTGDHAVAARRHREAAELFERTGDLRHAAMSLNSLGTALWSLGAYEEAREVHERSLATGRALGDRRLVADNLDNLGGVSWVLADFEHAVELYGQALGIRRDSADPRGVAISLLNIGDTYALTGDVERALAHYDEALGVDRGVGVRRNRATALQGKGKALLDAGRARDALECLDAAVEIHMEVADRDNLVDTHAARARAHLDVGDTASATAAASAALELLEPTDRPTLRQVAHYAAFRASAAVGAHDDAATHLARSVGAMDQYVDSLPTDARRRVLERVPINRLTQAAREAATTRSVVALPRVDVPLGRPVEPDETTRVTWTISDPGDALITSAAERRRVVMARLVAEASAQGASVTDDDLATAMQVSRRTVLRDAAELERQGRPLATRRRSRTP